MSMSVPAAESSRKLPPPPPSLTDAKIEDVWFEAVPRSSRTSEPPPSVPQKVGEFVGDALADGWFRS